MADVPTIFYHAGDIQPVLVRQDPASAAAVKAAIAKNPGLIAQSAINSASAQKGAEMNGFTKFLTGVAMVLGGLWLVAGLFYYYGQIDKAPPLWPTGSHERGIDNAWRGVVRFGDQSQFVGLLNGPSTNQVPPQQRFVDLNRLIAEASQGSRCDPQALALSAQHLPPNTVQVRLNEASCNFTWWAN